MYSIQAISYRVLAAVAPTSAGRRLALLLALAVSTTACTDWLPDAHRLEITQGNAITPEQVASLKDGMPKAQVRALLGVPVLQDPFHSQRWDYIFRYLPSDDSVKQSRLTLHFEDDILVRVDDSDYLDPDSMMPPPVLETDN